MSMMLVKKLKLQYAKVIDQLLWKLLILYHYRPITLYGINVSLPNIFTSHLVILSGH